MGWIFVCVGAETDCVRKRGLICLTNGHLQNKMSNQTCNANQ